MVVCIDAEVYIPESFLSTNKYAKAQNPSAVFFLSAVSRMYSLGRKKRHKFREPNKCPMPIQIKEKS